MNSRKLILTCLTFCLFKIAIADHLRLFDSCSQNDLENVLLKDLNITDSSGNQLSLEIHCQQRKNYVCRMYCPKWTMIEDLNDVDNEYSTNFFEYGIATCKTNYITAPKYFWDYQHQRIDRSIDKGTTPGIFHTCKPENMFAPRTLSRKDLFFPGMSKTWSIKRKLSTDTHQIIDLTINKTAITNIFPNLDLNSQGMTVIVVFKEHFKANFYVHHANIRNTHGHYDGKIISFTTSYFHKNRAKINFEINLEKNIYSDNIPLFNQTTIESVQILEGEFKDVMAIYNWEHAFVGSDGKYIDMFPNISPDPPQKETFFLKMF